MQVFRVRFVLHMTAPARMHAHHAAILYALLAQANAAAQKVEPCVPDGVLLDAPEQARLWLAQGSAYAFGLTVLASGPSEAGRIVEQLAQGLRKVGRRKDGGKLALGGNFEIKLVQDLVSGETHRTGHPLQPIARQWVTGEIERAAELTSLTLRFLSPLRAHRSKKTRRDGHQFFDREHFQPQSLVQRLVARLQGLGIDVSDIELGERPYGVRGRETRAQRQ